MHQHLLNVTHFYNFLQENTSYSFTDEQKEYIRELRLGIIQLEEEALDGAFNAANLSGFDELRRMVNEIYRTYNLGDE